MMVKNAWCRFFDFKPDSASIAIAASIHASSFGPSSAWLNFRVAGYAVQSELLYHVPGNIRYRTFAE